MSDFAPPKLSKGVTYFAIVLVVLGQVFFMISSFELLTLLLLPDYAKPGLPERVGVFFGISFFVLLLGSWILRTGKEHWLRDNFERLLLISIALGSLGLGATIGRLWLARHPFHATGREIFLFAMGIVVFGSCALTFHRRRKRKAHGWREGRARRHRRA